jgi:hypothetical protein
MHIFQQQDKNGGGGGERLFHPQASYVCIYFSKKEKNV